MQTKVEMTKREAARVASTLRKVQKIFSKDENWITGTWATHTLSQSEIRTLQRLGLWPDVQAYAAPNLTVGFGFRFSGRGSTAANASPIARRIKVPNCFCLGGAICKARGQGGPDYSDLDSDPISILTCCVLCEAIGLASLKKSDRYVDDLFKQIFPRQEGWPMETDVRERATGMVVGWNDHKGRTIVEIRGAVNKALIMVTT